MIQGIRIGDKLRSNDKRTAGRIVEVIAATSHGDKNFAVYQAGSRKAKVSFDLIYYEDGKHFNRGWTLVGEKTPPVR